MTPAYTRSERNAYTLLPFVVISLFFHALAMRYYVGMPEDNGASSAVTERGAERRSVTVEAFDPDELPDFLRDPVSPPASDGAMPPLNRESAGDTGGGAIAADVPRDVAAVYAPPPVLPSMPVRGPAAFAPAASYSPDTPEPAPVEPQPLPAAPVPPALSPETIAAQEKETADRYAYRSDAFRDVTAGGEEEDASAPDPEAAALSARFAAAEQAARTSAAGAEGVIPADAGEGGDAAGDAGGPLPGGASETDITDPVENAQAAGDVVIDAEAAASANEEAREPDTPSPAAPVTLAQTEEESAAPEEGEAAAEIAEYSSSVTELPAEDAPSLTQEGQGAPAEPAPVAAAPPQSEPPADAADALLSVAPVTSAVGKKPESARKKPDIIVRVAPPEPAPEPEPAQEEQRAAQKEKPRRNTSSGAVFRKVAPPAGSTALTPRPAARLYYSKPQKTYTIASRPPVKKNNAVTTFRPSAPSAPATGNARRGARISVQHYEQLLTAWISKFQRVPYVNGRPERGEGVVLIALTRSGRVLSARVTESAGSRALDEAAINMVHAASPVIPVPPDFRPTEPEITFAIPFRF